MSTASRSITVLTCDNCARTIDSIEAEVTGSLALRIWAADKGWRYAQAMVPMPPEHTGHRAVRRTWDFCDQCGIPPEIHTTVEVYGPQRGKLDVTLIGSPLVVSYVKGDA